MNSIDLPFLPAVTLGTLIKTREISPVEVTQAYLDRISQLNDELHGFITICAEKALSSARTAEESIRKGIHIGPLHGVPFAVKDQLWTKGILTTGGSRLLADFVPDEDATVVAKLQDAGAILLGKLNMSEFATGNSVYHHWGTPRNPWDLDRNPGTSSSGSGVATSAFLCATSLGEDTGGSIRNPANNCGLVGLRPTHGLVSRYGLLGASWSNDTAGPISRTVDDCAATLGAIAGYDAKDPYSAKYDIPDYQSESGRDIKNIRIGIVKEGLYADFIEPEVKELVASAIAHLGDLGASISEVSIPLLQYSAPITRIHIDTEAAPMHRYWLETRLDEYDHDVAIDFLTGMVTPGQLYYKVQRLRHLIRQQVFKALDEVDILALPCSSGPAPVIRVTPGIQSKEEAAGRISGRRSLTGVFNLSNVPAIAIPCGFVKSSGKALPTALQMAGRPFSDGLLLQVAKAYESTTSWHTQRPPLRQDTQTDS